VLGQEFFGGGQHGQVVYGAREAVAFVGGADVLYGTAVADCNAPTACLKVMGAFGCR
jgi:hypothetical protein